MANQEIMFRSLKVAAINAKNTENFFVSLDFKKMLNENASITEFVRYAKKGL